MYRVEYWDGSAWKLLPGAYPTATAAYRYVYARPMGGQSMRVVRAPRSAAVATGATHAEQRAS